MSAAIAASALLWLAVAGPLEAQDPPAAPASIAADTIPQWLTVGRDGLAVLTAPAGDTVGRTGAGTELHVVGREGNWARVRLEGWVWLPDADVRDGAEEGEDEILTGVSARDLTGAPERFRGRRLEIELEFLSLESAEAIRTDFYEGEPFILGRTRDEDRAFVYVAVSRDRLGEVEALGPLEPLRVTARVRTGAAAFTGNPVLDLIELERLR